MYDDGSTDGTDDALAPVRRPDPAPPARERRCSGGVQRAASRRSGDFVVVLDADDVFEPERIEALSELAAARPDLDIVTTDAAWESDGRVVGRFNGEANPFEVENQRAAILERCFIVARACAVSTVLGERRAGQSLEVAADWDCWIRMILGGSKAGSVDEPLLLYRLREGSVRPERLTSFQHRVDDARAAPDESSGCRDEDLAARDIGARAHRRTLALARALDAAHRGDPTRDAALAVARRVAWRARRG